jgi:hypothetical protein
MIGYDFSLFWNIGQAVLNGTNPYAIAISWYPPITSMVFAVFGLLPFLPAYAIWTGLNIIFYLSSLRQIRLKAPAWFLFAPAIFLILSGQLDFLFLWVAGFLPKGGWKAVAAAVIITLKPQIALIILPWFLVRWLKSNPRSVAWWLAATLILQLLPLFIRPTIFRDWLTAVENAYGWKMILSSGVFSLTAFGLPFWLAAGIALPIAIWGLFQDEATSRAAQLLACPVTFWYEDVFLAGSLPAKLLVPSSLLAFLMSYILQNALPLATIPLVVLVYRQFEERRKRLALASR